MDNSYTVAITQVFSQYEYQLTGNTDSQILSPTVKSPVCWTKPFESVSQNNTPPFKTGKMLGNRAVVADSFSSGTGIRGKSMSSSWCYKITTDTAGTNAAAWGEGSYTGMMFDARYGLGLFSHRSGYNALYGDFHATWYGDPQEQMAWWYYAKQGKGISYISGTGWFGSSRPDLARIQGASSPYYYNQHTSSRAAWHMIDMAAGIDVDAVLCQQYQEALR
jgi:hypothetical protein